MNKQAGVVFLSCLLMAGGLLQAALPVTNGLVCHLDAGTLSAGPVSLWPDQSGLTGNDGVQPDANWQPVCVTSSAFANRKVVRFDGVDDFLDLNGEMLNVNSFTVFIAAQFDRTGKTGYSYLMAGQTTGDTRLRINWETVRTPAVINMRAGNSANAPGWCATADTNAHIFAMTSQVSGYLDGTYLGTSANTASGIPGALNIGCYGGLVLTRKEFFKGDVAEVIFFNRVLTDTEKEQVGVYLSNKYPTLTTTYKNKAHNPVPANGAVRVQPQTSLTWNAGADPLDVTRVNPAIKKHYVWMRDGAAADPNLVLAATINITNYNDLAADGVYVKTPDLGYDKTYYWRVEEGLDNGQGGTYPAGDPNNLLSPVWTFQTASRVPTITLQPVSAKIYAGQTATFTMQYYSTVSATVAWYKDGQPLTAGGNVTIVTDSTSSTVTFTNANSGNEGQYYAIVHNIEGDSDPSSTAVLRLKQRLSWYQFEQNLNDSIGNNHGSVVGQLPYVDGMKAGTYAADPNGTPYAYLPMDAYPKAGFGNGLEEFTYTCWVKLAAGQGGILIGDFSDGQNTGMRFSIFGNEGNVGGYLRQTGGANVQVGTTAMARDSQWHHVAMTYNGSQLKVYVDGVWKANSGTNTLTNFAPWQYPPALLGSNARGTDVTERFRGQVDELQILNYALTTEQVAQEYLGVKGGWVCNSELPALPYDYDSNCQVDLGDLAIFAAEWLENNRIYAQ
jgi:hypothetical protein